MARWIVATALCAVALCCTCAAAHAGKVAQAMTGSAARVVPSLRSWHDDGGMFSLDGHSRIVIDERYRATLQDDAETFRHDLSVVTGLRARTVIGNAPHAGDIFLTMGASAIAPQGYALSIGRAVTIRGADAAGTFYGEQSIEQMLKLDAAHRRLPRGNARDWPLFRQRGFMLDLGRHYYAPAYVEKLIREAAWLKLNVVHLHFTEWSAFRLQSTTFPGLASAQSYSHADLRRFVERAHTYHVEIVPEIDVPGHSVAITTYDPALRFACPSMDKGVWPGGENGGWTLDVTKPQTTAFVTRLLQEFVPLFKYSPVIHLGGDEYPGAREQKQCPELVAYAATKGYASTEDVIVAWQNQMARILARMGKRMEVWNFWDYAGGATIRPSTNIIVESWTSSPKPFLDAGYDVVASGGPLYITPRASPGGEEVPPDAKLYGNWFPQPVQHLLGYEMCQWADFIGSAGDAYLDWFSRRPFQVLAGALWGGRRAPSVFAFEERADAVGTPPGYPDALPRGARLLLGKPFAEGDDSFGIDLGKNATARVVAVRFTPADDSIQASLAMVGGTFEGCTSGPASGCVPLATVRWRPTYDWKILPVVVATQFRWLRYVPPLHAKAHAGRVQFFGAPGSLNSGERLGERLRVHHPDRPSASPARTARASFQRKSQSQRRARASD